MLFGSKGVLGCGAEAGKACCWWAATNSTERGSWQVGALGCWDGASKSTLPTGVRVLRFRKLKSWGLSIGVWCPGSNQPSEQGTASGEAAQDAQPLLPSRQLAHYCVKHYYTTIAQMPLHGAAGAATTLPRDWQVSAETGLQLCKTDVQNPLCPLSQRRQTTSWTIRHGAATHCCRQVKGGFGEGPWEGPWEGQALASQQ